MGDARSMPALLGSTVLVRIGFSDGAYNYRRVEPGERHPADIEVPAALVSLWEAVAALDAAVAAQLRCLDAEAARRLREQASRLREAAGTSHSGEEEP